MTATSIPVLLRDWSNETELSEQVFQRRFTVLWESECIHEVLIRNQVQEALAIVISEYEKVYLDMMIGDDVCIKCTQNLNVSSSPL